MSDQLVIDAVEPAPPEHKIRALAGVLAGFRWPERGSFEKLTKPQKQAALTVARSALVALGREED